MSKEHQKIISEIIKRYKNKKGTIAIIIFGSLARGEERQDSDVDIEIISESEKTWQILKQKRYGVYIDLVLCPKKYLLYQVKDYPYLCYEHLFDKVIYDPQKFMAKIKEQLKKYFNKHPEIVKFWEKKLKIMKENKAKGQDPKDAIKSYDEAERLFSKEHKVTRNFFRE